MTRKDKSNSHAAEAEATFNEEVEPVINNWRRVFITFSITALAICYRMHPYFSNKSTDMMIGTWNKSIGTAGITKVVPCDMQPDEFKGCEPAKCGRHVLDRLVTEEESEALIKIAEKGMSLGGGAGGATIMDIHSWALSKGSNFVDLRQVARAAGIKELFDYEELKLYRTIKNRLQKALEEKWRIDPGRLYLTKPTFFSRMTAKGPTNMHDEYWHSHVDKEQYERFHYTTLLYLNTYKKDYRGGRLVFDTKGMNHTMEPKAGRVLMFTSGKENPHHVERVTKGTRYAITIPFTCDTNFAIPDPTF